MKKYETIHRPRRLIMVIPIMYGASMFEDLVIGSLFAFTLAYITSKIFPVIEIIEVKDQKSP